MLRIYSIYDSASDAYMRPFFAQSNGAAIRAFSDLVVSNDHPVGQHPADYTLFEIGAFDDNTGEIGPVVPKSLGNGLDYGTRLVASQIELEDQLTADQFDAQA